MIFIGFWRTGRVFPTSCYPWFCCTSASAKNSSLSSWIWSSTNDRGIYQLHLIEILGVHLWVEANFIYTMKLAKLWLLRQSRKPLKIFFSNQKLLFCPHDQTGENEDRWATWPLAKWNGPLIIDSLNYPSTVLMTFVIVTESLLNLKFHLQKNLIELSKTHKTRDQTDCLLANLALIRKSAIKLTWQLLHMQSTTSHDTKISYRTVSNNRITQNHNFDAETFFRLNYSTPKLDEIVMQLWTYYSKLNYLWPGPISRSDFSN